MKRKSFRVISTEHLFLFSFHRDVQDYVLLWFYGAEEPTPHTCSTMTIMNKTPPSVFKFEAKIVLVKFEKTVGHVT